MADRCPREGVRDAQGLAGAPHSGEDIRSHLHSQTLESGVFYGIQRVVVQDWDQWPVVGMKGKVLEAGKVQAALSHGP